MASTGRRFGKPGGGGNVVSVLFMEKSGGKVGVLGNWERGEERVRKECLREGR